MYDFLLDALGNPELSSANGTVLFGAVVLVVMGIIIGYKLISSLFHNIFF